MGQGDPFHDVRCRIISPFASLTYLNLSSWGSHRFIVDSGGRSRGVARSRSRVSSMTDKLELPVRRTLQVISSVVEDEIVSSELLKGTIIFRMSGK